jgi:hypothetical protein
VAATFGVCSSGHAKRHGDETSRLNLAESVGIWIFLKIQMGSG